MASPATEVDAGGRPVRVTNPDRVIYEATDHTPEVTKLMVVEYYVSVSDGIMRALRDRPTALERWPKGVREGIVLSTGYGDKADAFYQKRVPKGAPDYVETATITFPSGRNADEVCPTEVAVPAWAAQMGTLTFHPWPVRREQPDTPDELRIDLDPYGSTDFHDAVRIAGVAKELLDDLGMVGFPKTSGNRGVHVYIRIERRWDFVDVRHAAIAFGRELEKRNEGVTTKWWKEERGDRIFVDYNQNARDRTIASAYSLRPKPGAPVSAPMEWDELPEVRDPADFNLFTMPERFAERGDVHAAIDDVANDLQPLLELFEEQGSVELNYPPDYPKMPGEPPRVQPSKKVAEHWDEQGQWIGKP
jgi:DNA ligase D-like protein (predicted polymerase)